MYKVLRRVTLTGMGRGSVVARGLWEMGGVVVKLIQKVIWDRWEIDSSDGCIMF